MLITEQNRLVVKPEKAGQLVELLQSHYRDDTAIFCGPPVKDLSFGREKNIFIDMSGLTSVEEHVTSDMVIAVQTGITIKDLSALLAGHGQFFPVDMVRFGSGDGANKNQADDLRLIDVISSGDCGYLEQGYGYMRSLVLGLDLAYGAGKCAKLGGRVVKNVTGFDLTKLIVGGRGVFGLPYLAHLRLFAAPAETAYFVLSKNNAGELLLLAAKLLPSGLPLTGLELVEAGTTGGDSPGHQYSLIISVMGSDTLVSSVAKQLRENAGPTLKQISREELEDEYASLLGPSPIGLEMALSRASAAALIDHLASAGQRGLLRYRPGMSRFYLDCPDIAVLEKSYDLLLQFLSGTKLKTGNNSLAEFEQATISKSSGRYVFSSHSQRSNDAAFGKLVGRLRQTFDPLKCFNSGVTFHGC